MSETITQAPALVDLDSLDVRAAANAGARLELRNPFTGEKTGAWLDMQGADSDGYQAKKRELEARMLREVGRAGNAKYSQEDLQNQGTELLAAATTGWGGARQFSVPFSAAAAEKIYATEKWIWIREQADAWVHKRANFTPKSASGS